MRSRTLWGFVVGAAVCAFLTGAVSVQADDRPADGSKADVDRAGPVERVSSGNLVIVDDPNLPIVDNLAVAPPERMKLSPLPAGTVFTRHVVGDDASGGTAGADQLIYSNTEGKFSAKIPPGFLVSDDISTTAVDNCPLSRFTFQVTGQGDPNLPAAPYTVSWALYGNCPMSWPSADRPLLQVAGSNGSASFPDGDPRTIEFIPATPVEVDTTFWLGLTFTGDNAGPIVGAPAFVGYTGDVYDFPGFACNVNFGGFPQQPYGGFNAEVFGNNCVSNHTVYKAQRASGTPFQGGRQRWWADDLNLNTQDCDLVGYEVAVKEPARYNFALRYSCGGSAIPGTEGSCIVGSSSANRPRICRFKVAYICDDASIPAMIDNDCLQDSDCRDDDFPNGVCIEPIPIPQAPWLAAQITNDGGGIVVAGRQADIGTSQNFFGRDLGDGSCELQTAGPGVHAAFHASITCDGDAPIGACCDMYVTDENDDSVCREIPAINCSFPPPQSELRPRWIEGAGCDPDPFVEGTCGDSACCYKDADEDEYCTNLTLNECNAIPPLDNRRQWQRGRFCSIDNQNCPLNACLARQGQCTEGRDCSPPPGDPLPVGCQDPQCCTRVCFIPNQDFCCNTCWDAECAQVAQIYCTIPPTNDDCVGTRIGEGALLVSVPSINVTEHENATVNDDDPEFCCHDGLPLVCISEAGVMSTICTTDQDCQLGSTCEERPPVGLNSVWYKFEAPAALPGEDSTSVSLSTCLTSGSSTDSLLQAFSVNDPTSDETACNSLTLIGCSDDVVGCANLGRNGELCLQDLVPGDIYYVMVAAKTQEASATPYTLAVNSPCIDSGPAPNDYCLGALPLIGVCDDASAEPGVDCSDNGDCPGGVCVHEFDLEAATLHCPGPACATGMDKDLWYEYTATCTGQATIDTCSMGGLTRPDTNLAVYEGCDTCPATIEDLPIACNQDSDSCGPASEVEFAAQIGACYKVRVGNQDGNDPSGTIEITCAGECDSGAVAWVDPLNGTTDARRPHAPDSILPPMGIDTIVVTAPAGSAAPESCWRLCETDPGAEPNAISGVTEGPAGTYTISLARPITADAHTLIQYIGNDPPTDGRFFSHPGNVNDDFAVTTEDVQCLVDAFDDFCFPIWGEYSEDIDQSGMVTPLDILDAVDLLNGAEAYSPRNGTSKPSTTGCP